MTKNKTTVKKYKRRYRSPKKKGKTYWVKPYKRKKRSKGKKISYKPVGRFLVAHDDKGNFRGSKIIPLKTEKYKSNKTSESTKKPKSSKRRRKRPSPDQMFNTLAGKETAKSKIDSDVLDRSIKQLNTAYYKGEIDKDTWKLSRDALQ